MAEREVDPESGPQTARQVKKIICSIAPEFNGSYFPHLAITALALPALSFATTHTKFSSP